MSAERDPGHYRKVCRVCLRTIEKSSATMPMRKVPRAVRYDYCSAHKPAVPTGAAAHRP